MTDEATVPAPAPRARIRQAPAAPPIETIEQRQPALTGIMNQVAERYGSNVIQRAVAVPGFNQIETGIFTLDMALLGGFPEGLATMIVGRQSSGKTTLCKRVAGNMQRKYPDKAVVFVDCEQTYDNQWGAKHGIDNERLILSRPESGEHAVDIIDAVLQTDETAMVILDSIAALVPMQETESSAEDALMTLRARLMARLCSKISSRTMAARNRFGAAATVFMINQYRDQIGGRIPGGTVIPGGQQSKYLCTTIVETKGREILKGNGKAMEIAAYNEMAFNIKKSRVGNSNRNGEYVMIRDPAHVLGEGAIDDAGVVVAYAKRFGLVAGGGSSWRIDGDERRFGNLEQIANFIEEEPEEALDLKRRIIMVHRQSMGLLPIPADGYLLGYCEAA